MTFIAPIKFAIDLLAVLLLALGIKGLSKVRSAREANRLAAIAMILAAFGVLINSEGTIGISSNSWRKFKVAISARDKSDDSFRESAKSRQVYESHVG